MMRDFSSVSSRPFIALFLLLAGLAITATGCSERTGKSVPGDNTDAADMTDAGGDAGCTPTNGGEEVCDGKDNDCDGKADEEPSDGTTYYEDSDGDGFGNPDATMKACGDEPPEGYVADDSDCNDMKEKANPEAAETCDGVDNNCDGEVDEMSAQDAKEFFVDGDGDGFGNPDAVTIACEAPPRHVDNDEDCDDGDAEANPDGQEVCDGADNDCDGTNDEADAEGTQTYYEDGDGDGFGDPDSTEEACDAPNGYVENDEDCDDTKPDAHPMAEEVCNGRDNNCDGTADNPSDGESCTCKNGETQPCGTDAGVCSTGTQTCNNGSWGKCMGNKEGTTETCDGKDNDCDGDTDEGKPSNATKWYRDFDGDGYGNPSTTFVACNNPDPTRYVDNGKDCDDNNPNTNPMGTEKCDGVDNDCSGTADDPQNRNCTCALGASKNCGNDVGACRKGTRTCIKSGSGTEWSACSGATGPTAETCDGKDNDCDGVIDENEFTALHERSAGYCARISTGPKTSTLFCWGSNFAGELGDGTTTHRATPTKVVGSDKNTVNYLQLSGGAAKTCGTTHSDDLYCWGGQVPPRTTPEKVFNQRPDDLHTVSVGGGHTCAAITNQSNFCPSIRCPLIKQIVCWGDNGYGETGRGSTSSDEVKPGPVSGSSGFHSPAAGVDFTCALDDTDKAHCWGRNNVGQLGIGSTGGNETTPQPVTGGHTFEQLETEGSSTCGLDKNGQAWCWGDGGQGQLGDGARKDRSQPVKVKQGSVTFAEIGVAATHACGRTSKNHVYCWGHNKSNGDLLPGIKRSTTPKQFKDPNGTPYKFTSIEAGLASMCGMVPSNKSGHGDIKCWGNNKAGQLGNGMMGSATTKAPSRVSCVRP